MALTSVSTVKTLCDVTDSSEDAKLTIIVAAVDQAVKTWLGWAVESQTYVEYYQGNDRRYLLLKNRPVTSVTSIYLDNGAYYGQTTDAFNASTLLTQGVDYCLVKDGYLPGAPSVAVGVSGRVERIVTVWPGVGVRRLNQIGFVREAAPGNIKITYVAGYTTVPADLAYAAALLCQRLRLAGASAMTPGSESLIDYSVSYAQAQGNKGPGADAVSWLIGATLARYRRLAL